MEPAEGALCQTLSHLSVMLDKFDGRDKTIRSLYFTLVLIANRLRDQRKKDRLMAFAKQFSRTRLICRLFSQPSLLLSLFRIPRAFRLSRDHMDSAFASSVSVLYLCCGWTELISLLSELGFVGRATANIFKYFGSALHFWVLALALSIVRTLRQIVLRSMANSNGLAWRKNDRQWLRAQLLSIVGLSSDFVAAVNSLPRGTLWAGKLSSSQCASLHLTASLIGMYKQFQTCRLFSQPSLLLSLFRIPRAFRLSRDHMDSAFASSVSVLYLCCGWTELISLLSELGFVGRATANIFKYFGSALHFWVLALALSIVRTLRQIVLRSMANSNGLAWRKNDRQWLRAQLLSIVGLSSDFVAAVNSLPRGTLWAGKLSSSQCASLHLTASLIGMYKQFQTVKG